LLKVGLTGGIASGKSVVGEMFVTLGAHLVQADRIAHELMLPGQPVYNEVVRHFGGGILNPDLSVNRAKLAEAAFGPALSTAKSGQLAATATVPDRIQELNRIVHPAVIRSQNEWLDEMGRQDPHAVAIVEAALILEAGAAKSFDRLIVVTCSDEQRVARFAERQKLPLEDARREVARRMAAQLPEAEKIKAADFVIDNSGSIDRTREQVELVWQRLRSGMLAPRPRC
jgi:dephospho-CoA kinase